MDDPKKSGDLPVTQKMLNEVKQELKHEITSVSLDVKSLEAKMDSKFELVLAEIRKVSASVEEQNTRNKYVMDQNALLVSRMDHHESEMNERMTNLEDAVLGRKDL